MQTEQNYTKISNEVKFIDVLKHYGIPFYEKEGMLIGKWIIIDIQTNRYHYVNPKVFDAIDFVAKHKQCNMKGAALDLQNTFFKSMTPPEVLPPYDPYDENMSSSSELKMKSSDDDYIFEF
jgi:hypothetical protein